MDKPWEQMTAADILKIKREKASIVYMPPGMVQMTGI